MFKKIWNYFFGKCENETDRNYPFPESLKHLLPEDISMATALEFARWLEDALSISFTEVEIILFIASGDNKADDSDVVDYMLHISEPHVRKLLRRLAKNKLIEVYKDEYCDEFYRLTEATVSVIKRYT